MITVKGAVVPKGRAAYHQVPESVEGAELDGIISELDRAKALAEDMVVFGHEKIFGVAGGGILLNMSNQDTNTLDALKELWKEFITGMEDIPTLEQRTASNVDALRDGDQLVAECPCYLVDLNSKEEVRKLSFTCASQLRQYGAVVLRNEVRPARPWSGVLEDALIVLERPSFARRIIEPGEVQTTADALVLQKITPLDSKWKANYTKLKKDRKSEDFDGLFLIRGAPKPREWSGNFSMKTFIDREHPLPSHQHSRSKDMLKEYDTKVNGRLSAYFLEAIPAEFDSSDLSTPYLNGVAIDIRCGKEPVDLLLHPLRHVLRNLSPVLRHAWRHGSEGPSDGITESWTYVGQNLTFFPLHAEDAWLNSANLHLAGAPKIWIVIPRDQKEELLKKLEKRGLEPCVVNHRDVFVHPRALLRWGIKFNVIVQEPGDLILTDNLSLHEGYNAGENLATAVNFLTPEGFELVQREYVDGRKVYDPCLGGYFEYDGRKCVHWQQSGDQVLNWISQLVEDSDEEEMKRSWESCTH